MTSARATGTPTESGGRSLFSRIRPFRSWTIRSRVVLVVVAMLAVLGAVIGTISVVALQSYLMTRLDGQLTSAVARGQSAADRAYGPAPTGPDATRIVNTPGQPVGTFGVVRSGSMLLYPAILGTRPSGSSTDPAAPQVVTIATRDLISMPADGKPRTVDLGSSLGEYRVAGAELINGDSVIIGLPLSEVNATVSQLTLVIALVTLAGLIFAFLIASFVVRLAMRPLARVAGTAQQVAEMPLDRGDVALSVRVPEADTDPHTEVGTVGSALNRMLGHVASALTARQASEQKVRQFVADASHELRTPLASLAGFIETLRGHAREDEGARDKFLGIMQVQAERMRRLIEDLMSLSRIELNEHVPPSGRVDVALAAVDVLDALGPIAAERCLTFRQSLPPRGVAVVGGDRDQILQVIQNLVENAMKYSPTGGEVSLEMRLDLDAADAGAPRGPGSSHLSLLTPDHAAGLKYVALTVRDSGPGIAREHLPRLTERFYRVEGQKSGGERSGTGLGLAIVKHIMNRHRGGLMVESVEGAGAAFTVYFPTTAVAQAQAA